MTGLTDQERQQIEANFQRLADAYRVRASTSIEIQTTFAEQKSNNYGDGTLKQQQFNEIAGRYGFQVLNIDRSEAVSPGLANDRVVPLSR